jgi:hypothetical protein
MRLGAQHDNRTASRRVASHGTTWLSFAPQGTVCHGTSRDHYLITPQGQNIRSEIQKTRPSLLGERHHLDRHKHHQHHSLFPAVHRAITHAPLCSLCVSPSTPSIVPCCPPSHHRRTCLLAVCLTNSTTGHSRCFQTVHSHGGACQVLHPTCQQQQHQQSTV